MLRLETFSFIVTIQPDYFQSCPSNKQPQPQSVNDILITKIFRYLRLYKTYTINVRPTKSTGTIWWYTFSD